MIKQAVYNGFTFTNSQANLEGFVGAGTPEIRSSRENKAQQDGAVPTGYRYGARTFGWSGRLSSTTFALYRAHRIALMRALNMQNLPLEGADMVFTLLDGTTVLTLREVRLVANVLDFPEDEPSIVHNSYQLTFDSTFGFLEGDTVTGDQQVTNFDRGTVVPSPVPSPLNGIAVVSSGTDPLLIENEGSANAYPVLTITGPGTTFTVLNSTTGQSFTIAETLAAGETIVIDTWNKTVMKGTDSVLGSFVGSFFTIWPGQNSISFSVGSGSTTDTQLETVFKHTFLGI